MKEEKEKEKEMKKEKETETDAKTAAVSSVEEKGAAAGFRGNMRRRSEGYNVKASSEFNEDRRGYATYQKDLESNKFISLSLTNVNTPKSSKPARPSEIIPNIGPDIASNIDPDIAPNIGQDIASNIGPHISPNIGPDISPKISPSISLSTSSSKKNLKNFYSATVSYTVTILAVGLGSSTAQTAYAKSTSTLVNSIYNGYFAAVLNSYATKMGSTGYLNATYVAIQVAMKIFSIKLRMDS